MRRNLMSIKGYCFIPFRCLDGFTLDLTVAALKVQLLGNPLLFRPGPSSILVDLTNAVFLHIKSKLESHA